MGAEVQPVGGMEQREGVRKGPGEEESEARKSGDGIRGECAKRERGPGDGAHEKGQSPLRPRRARRTHLSDDRTLPVIFFMKCDNLIMMK